MSVLEAGDIFSIPAYTPEAEQATVEVQWSQTHQTRQATYYTVHAKNVSKSNADVTIFVQDRFYKSESSTDYIGRIPGGTKDGGRPRHHSWPTLLSVSDIDSHQRTLL